MLDVASIGCQQLCGVCDECLLAIGGVHSRGTLSELDVTIRQMMQSQAQIIVATSMITAASV